MKKIVSLVIFIVLVLFMSVETYASTTDTLLEKQFDIIDIENFGDSLKGLDKTQENQYVDGFNLKDTVTKLIKGDINFSLKDMLENLLKLFFKEIYSQTSIMKNIIIIACVCALAKNLSSAFESKAVGEMAFYVCYIVIVILLLQSFRVCVELVMGTVDSIADLLNVFLPVLTALLISSGNYMSLSMVHPIVILVSEVMTVLIKNIIIPFIFLAAVFEIVNYISEKSVLGNLSELMKKCIGWVIKGVSIVFTTTVTLQKLTLPAVEGMINKTAKLAIGAIPVVGEVMTGTVDTVLGWSGLVKNSTAIAVILFMLILCTMPILKLVALILVYKFTAAIIQPISDSRIVKCIDGIAASCQLLLGSLVCVMFMFLLVAIIGISSVVT